MKSCYDPRFILILGGLDVALMGNLGFFPLVFRYQLVVFCHWLIMEVVLLSLCTPVAVTVLVANMVRMVHGS